MRQFTPASSNIAGVSYDDETKALTVDFLDGSRYQYSRVPPEVYDAFERAPSAGSFLYRQIRDRYPYVSL